MTVSFRVE